MARDLNRLFDDIRQSRPVYITQDGQVEDADEAEQNADQEELAQGAPRPRTQLKPEVFGEQPAITVHTSVIDHMHEEAQKHPGETGGIVIGPDESTITELLASGPDAERSSSSYVLDHDYLQPLLDKAEERGLRFLGIWHTHPEGSVEPSNIDRDTARRVLSDPDYDVSRLLLPLSVRRGEGFETRLFVAEGDEPDLRAASIILCSGSAACDDAPEAETRLGGAEASSLSQSFPGPRFVRARLRADQLELERRGWSVTLRRLGKTPSWTMSLVRRGVRLVVQFPVEYPISPPEVLVQHGRSLWPVPYCRLPETDRWSSLRSLADVATQAAEAVRGANGRTLGRRAVGGWIRSLIVEPLSAAWREV